MPARSGFYISDRIISAIITVLCARPLCHLVLWKGTELQGRPLWPPAGDHKGRPYSVIPHRVFGAPDATSSEHSLIAVA